MPWRKPNENYRLMYRHFPEVLHFQQEVQEKEWERKHAPPTLRQRRHSPPLPGIKGLQDLRWQPDEWKDATLSYICDCFLHRNYCCGTVTMLVESSFSLQINWNNQGPVLPACAPQRSWQGTSALAKFASMMPVSRLIHTVWAVQLYDSWLSWRGGGVLRGAMKPANLTDSLCTFSSSSKHIYIYTHKHWGMLFTIHPGNILIKCMFNFFYNLSC